MRRFPGSDAAAGDGLLLLAGGGLVCAGELRQGQWGGVIVLTDSCETCATIAGVEGVGGKTGRGSVAMFLAPHRPAPAAACRVMSASSDEIRRSSFMSPMGSYLPVTASLSVSTTSAGVIAPS